MEYKSIKTQGSALNTDIGSGGRHLTMVSFLPLDKKVPALIQVLF